MVLQHIALYFNLMHEVIFVPQIRVAQMGSYQYSLELIHRPLPEGFSSVSEASPPLNPLLCWSLKSSPEQCQT